jgi:NAD(P)-dependent dehydrogenase (short-subunit alcohol dehydrogenase family)
MNRPLALVTGAAGDIGTAIASRLATSGWDLVLWDHPDAAQLLDVRTVEHRSAGTKVDTMTFDITDEGAILDAVAAMGRSSGAPAGVVCCAGYQGTFAPLNRYPSGELRRVVDVNLVGVFLVLVYYASDPRVVERQMIGMVPMRRYGSPAEVAAVVAFLLSDESSYLTGVNIEISGGST